MYTEAGGKVPKEAAHRIFNAMKPLLRPGTGVKHSWLTGPWTKPPPGRAGVPNPRKGLGQLLNRLAVIRKQHEVDAGGEAAELENVKKRDEQLLTRVSSV